MQLVTHPDTRAALAKMAASLPQSLLLTGEQGSGLATIARDVAGSDLINFLQPVNKKGEPDAMSGTISVEMIRGLYEQTRSRQTKRRVVVIDDADRMSPAAQASFLKLLEEPTAHTHFILTSHAPQRLLPTIRSRLQALHVRGLTPQQTNELIDALGIKDAKKRSQLTFIAAGLPAELTRLAQEETYFAARAKVIADARDFLVGAPYVKLLVANKYQSDRPGTLQLIDDTIAIARRSLSGKPQPALVAQLSQLLELREHIAGNGSIRLQLTSFVL